MAYFSLSGRMLCKRRAEHIFTSLPFLTLKGKVKLLFFCFTCCVIFACVVLLKQKQSYAFMVLPRQNQSYALTVFA
jgi:hypothetical protein